MHKALGWVLIAAPYNLGVAVRTPLLSAVGRWRQENQDFKVTKVTFSYTSSLSQSKLQETLSKIQRINSNNARGRGSVSCFLFFVGLAQAF